MFRYWFATAVTLLVGMLYVLWGYLRHGLHKVTAFSSDVSNDDHLKSAVDWLIVAHQMGDNNGFASAFSLRSGWGKPYPETTGYLIPTLINFIRQSNYRQEDLLSICYKSGDWLISIQRLDGSFPGYETTKSIIFDTGQIILGLCAMYQISQDSKYLGAAMRAGNWLCSMQEQDGSWIKNTYNRLPRAYTTFVDIALIKLSQLSKVHLYQEVAIRNLDWAMSQQLSNGWYKNSSFKENKKAVLHTIAYTLQGLIESGMLLKDDKYIKSAQEAADVLLFSSFDNIPSGFYSYRWKPLGHSKCLTGLAQMGIVWHQLFNCTQDQKYLTAAQKTFSYLKSKHNISIRDANLRGSLGGSYPIGGTYMPFAYPNWAVKFFIDLGLLLNLNYEREI